MSEELLPKKFWSFKSAVEQVSACEAECTGGPLAMNDAFIWLKQATVIGPEFLPGQGVYFKVDAHAAGQTLSQWLHFYIVGCEMESGTDDRYFTYRLSNDPPRPYHYGTVQFAHIRSSQLRLEIPS